jgi:hypothetical protein
MRLVNVSGKKAPLGMAAALRGRHSARLGQMQGGLPVLVIL